MPTIEVSGAYGRTYATPAAMRADWEAGQDFIAHTFHGDQYSSIRDWPRSTVIGRYGVMVERLATLQRGSD